MATSACLELRLLHQDEAMADARRAFLAAVAEDLRGALRESRPTVADAAAALATERQQLQELEEDVRSCELEVLQARLHVSALGAQRGVLQSPSRADPWALPGGDDEGGGVVGGLLEAPVGPLQAGAASSSGRYLALAGGSRVALCEACSFGVRVVTSRCFGQQVAAVSFFGDDPTGCALLVASQDLCLGWEPPEEPDARPEQGQLFLQIRLATGGRIVDMATSRGRGGRPEPEVLLLGTDRGSVEVYGLRLEGSSGAPELLRTVRVGADIAATSLLSWGALAAVAAAEGGLTPPTAAGEEDAGAAGGELHVYEVASGRCLALLKIHCGPAASTRLAYSAAESALAAAGGDGLIEIFAEGGGGGDRGHGPVAYGSGPSFLRLGADTLTDMRLSEELAGELKRPVTALAWCGDQPLLAAGGRGSAVLIYAFRVEEAILECVAMLSSQGDGAPPVSLAWAPDVGMLVAAYGAEWQFWLLGREEWMLANQCADPSACEDPSPRAAGASAAGDFLLSSAWEQAEEEAEEAEEPLEQEGGEAGGEEGVRSLFSMGGASSEDEAAADVPAEGLRTV